MTDQISKIDARILECEASIAALKQLDSIHNYKVSGAAAAFLGGAGIMATAFGVYVQPMALFMTVLAGGGLVYFQAKADIDKLTNDRWRLENLVSELRKKPRS